ncbi:MAG: Txe/YoeB family addiction module toxin [Sphingobacteriales bacterium]
MEIIYLPKAGEDLIFWINSGNKAILKKITQLTEAIIQSPHTGIGKPEALKYALAGKWSRRITDEHRYIYQIENNILKVYS